MTTNSAGLFWMLRGIVHDAAGCIVGEFNDTPTWRKFKELVSSAVTDAHGPGYSVACDRALNDDNSIDRNEVRLAVAFGAARAVFVVKPVPGALFDFVVEDGSA